jgi:subtilisin family serine protease
MNRSKRLLTHCLFLAGLCLPLLAGSSDPGPVAGKVDTGAITAEGEPLSILEQYKQFRRDRLSPTDLPGATGSAQHPSQYGPARNDPAQGIPKHAYSPFDPATSTQSHCPSKGCDYAPDAVLIKLKPEVSVAAPAAAGARQAAVSLDEPGVLSEPELARALWDQGLDELQPLFPGASQPVAGAMATRRDGVQVDLPDLTRWYRVKAAPAAQSAGMPAAATNPAPLDIPALVKELAASPGVELAEPDYVRKPIGGPAETAMTAGAASAQAAAPLTALFDTDPRVGEQWHLDAAQVPAAWQHLADHGLPAGGSSDVVVAVIDTGVDYTHPDLAANMWVNAGEFGKTVGVDDDGNGYVDDIHGARVIGGDLSGSPTDDHGHGTHVAGIIAAQADNGIGGVGVAPGVRIMAIKAAQYSGILNASDVARGIYYAVEKGADVINMSFGGYARSIAEEDALTVAFGSAVLVAAAGNHSKVNLPCPSGANMYPAAYNWVLGVMAHGENGRRASFSNFDCTQNDAQEYELMAPGTQILSTLPQDGYGAWSGTSMATPVVAGIAALARTQWPDKQSYSSRFIMGQIASTANYGPADALATLAEVPQPSLSYLEHYLFDTPQSAAGNDNDGIVDAGETVELAVVIRNHWGKADNVQVTLQAQAEGAFQADPYVTILTGTVNYGAVGSFNNDDNGLIKDAAGAIIGVEQPFRFHVADTTPNDHLIPFLLTMTADNGYDPGAGSVTSSSRFYLLVQRGRELPRVITQDMTLTKDDYWLVPSATLIPEGVTVTVTEGTQIQFFSADPSDPYAIPLFVQIQVEGNLFVQGTISEPVEFFTGLLYPAHPLIIAPTGNGDVRLAYSRISNPVLGGNQIDHVYFIQTDPNSLRQWLGGSWLGDSGSPTISSKLINATIFESMGTAMPVDIGGALNGSLLDSTYITQTYKFESESPLISGVVNNVFLRNYKTINLPINDPVRQSKITLEPEGYSNFYNNAILNNWNILDIFNYWMRIYMSGGRGYMASASNNYWGTISTTLIDKAIYDFNDDFNLGVIQYQPILTTPPETAYPFVASVTVATNAGPATQIGAEPISVTVTFNRDMDPDVQPQVSFGPAEPYTDYSVGGDWTNARTWTGTFNVTPITGDGEQSIRVAGAVAADDAWLVTGNDFGRFRFEIITSGSSAMNLQASGGEGKVSLWWSQTDFDTLAGYHLYRSTSSNSGFSRLNATLIPRGLTTWEDTNVTPGQPYYYYFTVVETDFNESDPSATVTATPTDTIPPVISHTPITSAPPGQPLSLTATATDNVAVKSVTLYHRPLGGSSYASRAMIKTTGNSYSATLEGSLVSAPGIDYYLAASDGISVARSGSAALPWQVAVQDKPTLTSVTPASGPAEGGTSVTVTGTNFKAGATVTFGGAACGSVVRVSSTQITCTTPAHFPEQVDVIVTNPDTKSGTLLRGFTFISQTAALGVPNLTGGQGLLVQVPINIANVQGMLSAALTLSFDPAVLRIQGATTGSLTPGWTLVANTGVAGQVTLSMSSAGTVMGAGVLASLEFEVIGPPEASSPLTLSGVVLNDGAIPAETTNGSLTVDSVYSLSGSVQYWNASRPVPAIDLVLSGPRLYRGTSGSDGSYSVIGVPAGSYTLTPGGATVEGGISALDASLALRHQAGLETLSGNALKAADVNQNGSVTAHDASYILQRAAGLIDLPFQGAGSVWLFDPVVRNYTALAANQTGQNFTAILLGDPSGNWPGSSLPLGTLNAEASVDATSAVSATLTLPNLPIPSGQQVVVPLTLDLAEGGVQAADLEFRYDPAVVTVVRVDGGDLPADWILAANDQASIGAIRASLAGATPVAAPEGRVFLRVTFVAKGSAGTVSDLLLPAGALDEGGLASTAQPGMLVVGETFRGDDLALGGTVESKADYAASRSITLGPRLTLGATSNVTMRAGERIVFKPGFRVKAGARFAAAIDSGLTP